MPELPEVETVKSILSKLVINHTILNVEVFNKRQIEGDVNEFIFKLQNKKILSLSRIGKYLIFHLEDELVMISHLRMEGKYFNYLEEEPNSKYARVVFHLDNGHKLCYDDSRTFGILMLSDESHYLSLKEIAKLGKEPFDIDPNDLYKLTRNIKTPIKTALLDQTLMTGLGNIYVDEVLYASNIHPHTPSYLLNKDDYINIVNNSIRILNRAIELGGSTIKSYHPGKDIDGNFQTEIKIYGKKDETCPKCGHTFLFTKTNGRGTTFCPGCQHKLGAPLTIGLTGVIASGKSTALEMFKEKGYLTISSDEVVANLYQKEEIINKINKMFNLSFNKKIDRKILRDHLLIHPKDKKRLENLIHPLVKKEIINILKKDNHPIRVIEVPLLFKAHYEDLFDSIIIIDIDENIQNERLINRGSSNSLLLKEINKDNQIEENKNKAEFLASNNLSSLSFEKEINKIIRIMKSRLN